MSRRRYIEKEVIPPGIALVVGSATHRSIRKNLAHKLETKTLLPIEQIRDEARDGLVAEWDAKGVALTPEEFIAGVKQVKADAIDKAVRLSVLHAEEKAPGIELTHVERSWVIELPGHPMDLVGQIDVQNGTICLRDTKTAAKTPPATVADESDQLTAYAMAIRVLDGKAPDKVVLDYLIDNKVPVAKTFESVRDASDFQALLHRIENAIAAIQKGVFIPARQTDWCCSEKWCGYFRSCKFVKQPKSISLSGRTNGSE